jgi:4-amino-4-deoxy-L-arabinose transferase-like glycosyltransferase
VNLPLRLQRLTGRRGADPVRTELLLLPLLLILPVAFLVVDNQFDGLYGQDSYAYYHYASGPLRDRLLALQPPPPFFWPPGYPLLVFLLSLLVGNGTTAAQLASLVPGALVPVLTALLARELWPEQLRSGIGRWLPLLAGLFAALTGQLWQSSAVIMSDTTGLAAATLGAWALARYGRGSGGRWLLLAAGASGYSVLARWAYGLVALPLAVAALFLLARRPRRQAIAQAIAAAIVVLAVLSPVIIATLQGSVTGESGHSAFTGDLEVVTWHPFNALQREFVNSDGSLRYRLPNGLYYALAPAHRAFFTPLLALLLLPGLLALWRQRTPLRLLMLAGWPATVYLFLAGVPWQNFRFVLPYLPPLAIVAALGVTVIAGRLSGQARLLFGLLLGTGFLWMAHGGWSLTGSFIARKEADLQTVHWVEAQLPPEAGLFTFGITLTVAEYSELDVYDLYYLTPEALTALLRDDRPAYLLLDLENVESQWQGRAPSTNYHWLQDQAGLEEMGRQRQYTLFRAGGGLPASSMPVRIATLWYNGMRGRQNLLAHPV